MNAVWNIIVTATNINPEFIWTKKKLLLKEYVSFCLCVFYIIYHINDVFNVCDPT